ncbi:hypothetical protein RHMOL_Rhmol04G0137900 [Rhododendron molle]|uniref:Uncharacterized protein n=1 Tax=Rhododendron molle TaxID=49168 RepID=A0ACC0P2I9_RHOML|nr:hypothetical protein RHMOL_Rhmol04G0137900 [Rhododendron molle]
MPGPSFSLIGSVGAQPGPHISSSMQLQQKHQIRLDRFGCALNIEALVAAAERRETPLEALASEIQDKISFIINNLSSTNFEAKAKEFSEILTEQYCS